jgi:CheY-like chemotaxis protein
MSASVQGILLVEDDENDVFFLKRAMIKTGLSLAVQVARDGREAISYMSGAGIHADRATYPMPCCIFLDLKMPFISGFEFLEWLRNQPALSHFAVIVLTSSPEDRDQSRALQLGARAYLIKPPTAEMILNALKSVPECTLNAALTSPV